MALFHGMIARLSSSDAFRDAFRPRSLKIGVHDTRFFRPLAIVE
jgi:hypothetical protein